MDTFSTDDFMTSEERNITLGVLRAVHGNANVTQRSVAKEVEIALGLANSYLKRCIKKGFIKVQQAPANRYAYYLTPRGLAEKGRLTREYLSQGFYFFRVIRNQADAMFRFCDDQGWRRIILHGLPDIAEVVTLCAANFKIEIVGIVDETTSRTSYNGIPVYGDMSELNEFDAVMITDLGDPQLFRDRLRNEISEDRILELRVQSRPKSKDHEGGGL